jgi:hypothetical protein
VGYDSHYAPGGGELVFFASDQLLPVFLADCQHIQAATDAANAAVDMVAAASGNSDPRGDPCPGYGQQQAAALAAAAALADPSYYKQFLERIEAHGYGAQTNAQIKSDLAAFGMSTKGRSKKVLADRLKDGLRDKVAAASEAAAAASEAAAAAAAAAAVAAAAAAALELRQAFESCKTFSGNRDGWVFKLGGRGIGYYKERGAAASPKDDKMLCQLADDDAEHKLKRKNPWE